ncbi:Uncharacterised protein [Escherichia coli]|uniref:Uncharacterized protein n=1 Tax=Escherichia coli TaxID=562 RepID=A0A376ZLT4_ECOLX|nr:Uncharacterised protein [Escherichia coli]
MEMTVVAGSVMTGLAVKTVLDGMTGAVTVCFTGTAFFVVVITFVRLMTSANRFVAPVAAIAVPSPSRLRLRQKSIAQVLHPLRVFAHHAINCGKATSDLTLGVPRLVRYRLNSSIALFKWIIVRPLHCLSNVCRIRLMPLTLGKQRIGVQRDRRNPLIDLCSAECGFDDGGRYGRCGNRCRERNCGDVRRSLLCRLRFHRRFHCAAFYI